MANIIKTQISLWRIQNPDGGWTAANTIGLGKLDRNEMINAAIAFSCPCVYFCWIFFLWFISYTQLSYTRYLFLQKQDFWTPFPGKTEQQAAMNQEAFLTCKAQGCRRGCTDIQIYLEMSLIYYSLFCCVITERCLLVTIMSRFLNRLCSYNTIQEPL